MDLQTKLLYLFADLVMPLFVGYLCHYQTKLTKDFFQRMIIINICVIYLFLSLLTTWVLPLDYSLIWLPVIGLLLFIIPGIAAYFRQHKFKSELDKGSYILSAMMSNTTSLGGLCAYIMCGEVGFAATQMFVLLQNMAMFMVGFPLAQHYYQKSLGGDSGKRSWSRMFFNRTQLPIIGIIIGVILNATHTARPALLGQAVDPLVHIAAWTALVPVGYAIDVAGMRQYFTRILDLIPIKFILTPVIGYLLARVLFTDELISTTVVILATMPTAINTVVAVQLYKLNVNIATAAFVMTTAAFIVLVLPTLLLWMSVR